MDEKEKIIDKNTDETMNDDVNKTMGKITIESTDKDIDNKEEIESKAYAPISVSPNSITVPSYSSATDVSISCTDSTWKAGTTSGWAYMQKVSQTKAKIIVAPNTGGVRVTGVTAVNGPHPATVIVTQSSNIDVKNKITLYKQKGGTCAATCACMCVNVNPDLVQSDWMENAQWADIGNMNGYSLAVDVMYYDDSDEALRPTFYSVFNDSLAKGLPAIVKINTDNLQHWVVLVCFSGSKTSDVSDPSKYICADPVSGEFVRLDLATQYGCINSKFFNRVVYKKN